MVPLVFRYYKQQPLIQRYILDQDVEHSNQNQAASDLRVQNQLNGVPAKQRMESIARKRERIDAFEHESVHVCEQ